MTGRNGRPTNGVPLLMTEARVIEEEIQQEIKSVLAGDEDTDPTLLQAIVNNWPFEKLLNTLDKKRNSWRVLAPLTDKIIEIQGWSTLHLVGHLATQGLNVQTVKAGIQTIKQLNTLQEEYEAKHGTDPDVDMILAQARTDAVEATQKARARFERRMDRLLG